MPKKAAKSAVKKTARSSAAKKVATKKTAAKKAVTKKVAAKKKSVVAKKAAPKKQATKKAAVKKTTTRKVVRKKAAKSKASVVTTIIAKIDAGYGNDLYIRGSGSELTWDTGTLMQNTQPDEWVWTSDKVTEELEFKVLVNDYNWAGGPNGVVFPGATVVFEPLFQS